MVPEDPTAPGLALGVDPCPLENPTGRVDLVRYAVHAALAVYLLPVLMLVAVIGLVSIAVNRVASVLVKATRALARREGWPTYSRFRPQPQVIGTRPAGRAHRKRTRVIR
jgi:hypothetical protein